MAEKLAINGGTPVRTKPWLDMWPGAHLYGEEEAKAVYEVAMNKSELIDGLYRYSWLLLDKQGVEISVPPGPIFDAYMDAIMERQPASRLSWLLLKLQPKKRQRLDNRIDELYKQVQAERANSILDQVIELLQDELT